MRTLPTVAALFVTLCWAVSVLGLFTSSGPWVLFWMACVSVNGFCLCDLWHDAWRAWMGRLV
jgi:hypothetical protein